MLVTLLKAGVCLLPAWVWVALAAALAGGGGWIWHQFDVAGLETDLANAKKHAKDLAGDLEHAEQSRDAWQARAEQRQADLEAAHQERRDAQSAVRQFQEDLATQDAKYRQLQQRIAQTPPEDDGPVAPVLRDAIRDLPEVAP